MTTKLAALFMVAGTLGSISSVSAQRKASSSATTTIFIAQSPGPKIRFAETVHDFGKVDSGEVVKHDFVFTNMGTATLEIKDVRTGCGCTTVGAWHKQVEPGKTGSIPLKFDSANFGGQVTKSALVICNDPGQTNVLIQLTGSVWKAIEATPLMTVFSISSEVQTNETKTVRIVSNLDEPVEVSDPQCTNHSFNLELKTVRPGKEFELAITAMPPFASIPVIAPVTLKTSTPRMPTIKVSAYVILHEVVVVAPDRLTLPMGPLPAALSPAITIRNSGTNFLVLSEARVSGPGAQVHVQEIQPGRLFSLQLNFPAGFEIKPDRKVEVSVTSNHPKFPLIKVPVIQMQSPAGPDAAQSASSQVQGGPVRLAAPTAAEK